MAFFFFPSIWSRFGYVEGETTFLEALPGDGLLAASGGVAAGERRSVAKVRPKRGRLLLMLGLRTVGSWCSFFFKVIRCEKKKKRL